MRRITLKNRNRNAFRPAVEGVERRLLLAGDPALELIGDVAGTAGDWGIDTALSYLGADAGAGQLAKIQSELNQIDTELTAIESSLTSIINQLSSQTLNSVIQTLNIPDIQTYWGDLQTETNPANNPQGWDLTVINCSTLGGFPASGNSQVYISENTWTDQKIHICTYDGGGARADFSYTPQTGGGYGPSLTELSQLYGSHPKTIAGSNKQALLERNMLAETTAVYEQSTFSSLATNIISHLGSSTINFENALDGNSTTLPLMTQSSKLWFGTTNDSTQFLTSSYSTMMQDIFNYYDTYQMEAALLLADAYNYQGVVNASYDAGGGDEFPLAVAALDQVPISPSAQAPTWDRDVADQNTAWNTEYGTLPQAITSGVFVDTANNVIYWPGAANEEAGGLSDANSTLGALQSETLENVTWRLPSSSEVFAVSGAVSVSIGGQGQDLLWNSRNGNLYTNPVFTSDTYDTEYQRPYSGLKHVSGNDAAWINQGIKSEIASGNEAEDISKYAEDGEGVIAVKPWGFVVPAASTSNGVFYKK